jgi:hypothetical protein
MRCRSLCLVLVASVELGCASGSPAGGGPGGPEAAADASNVGRADAAGQDAPVGPTADAHDAPDHDAGSSEDAGEGAEGGPLVDAKAPGEGGKTEDSGTGGDAAASTGCQYATVFTQTGPVLTVGTDQSKTYYWSTEPLPSGSGFTCLKVDFDMATANTLGSVGCPIYTLVTGIHGTGAKGTPPSQAKLLAGALFKFYDLKCQPAAHRIELDTSWKSLTTTGPWNLGGVYHFTVEIKPYTSTVTLSQGGVVVGPVMSADITGATVADTLNPRIDFGDPAAGGGSNWPNYGATYSNVVIQADVAP